MVYAKVRYLHTLKYNGPRKYKRIKRKYGLWREQSFTQTNKWTCRKINVEYLINNFKPNVHALLNLNITVLCRLRQIFFLFRVLEVGLVSCSPLSYYTLGYKSMRIIILYPVSFRILEGDGCIERILYVAVYFPVSVKILSILLKMKVGKIKVHVFMRQS